MAKWQKSGTLSPGGGLAVGQKVNVNVEQSFGGALEKGEIVGTTSSGYRVRLAGGKEVEVAARFVRVDHYANAYQNGQARAEAAIRERVENANPLSVWARDVKKTEEEARKKAKAENDYVVVMHSNGSGYVVRTRYAGYIPAPYQSAKVEKAFKSEAMAQKYADKLNGY